MKLEVPLLAGLVFVATQMLARAQVQGFEAALVSSGMEYGLRVVSVGSKLFRDTLGMRSARIRQS
jgi:hypothetical protein